MKIIDLKGGPITCKLLDESYREAFPDGNEKGALEVSYLGFSLIKALFELLRQENPEKLYLLNRYEHLVIVINTVFEQEHITFIRKGEPEKSVHIVGFSAIPMWKEAFLS